MDLETDLQARVLLVSIRAFALLLGIHKIYCNARKNIMVDLYKKCKQLTNKITFKECAGFIVHRCHLCNLKITSFKDTNLSQFLLCSLRVSHK